jgi:uncharacterized protein YkwD
MFRKFLKPFKILLIIIVIIICIPYSILPLQKSKDDTDSFEYYKTMNDTETRLPEFKDSDSTLKIKLLQLNIINKSRKSYKADPVKLDILASRVANKMCAESAENGYIGHWNMAGEKPYHRYAFAGGKDHVSENAFGEWSTNNYFQSSSTISKMMKSGHDSFMSEHFPNDGHKKNIIDKSHNFVGIGFYLTGKQFRYYEEFIDRYFEFEDVPDNVKLGETCYISLKTTNNNYLYFLTAYRENEPKPLAPSQIMKRTSYDDFSNEEYFKMPAWELNRYRSGFLYKIPLSFSKEGLYYVQIYYDKKEISKPVNINTKDKSPASGIVIKVTK